jgi:hypothetical protein
VKGKGTVYEFTRKNVAKHNHTTTTTEKMETSWGTASYGADSSLEDSDKDSSGERGSGGANIFRRACIFRRTRVHSSQEMNERHGHGVQVKKEECRKA